MSYTLLAACRLYTASPHAQLPESVSHILDCLLTTLSIAWSEMAFPAEMSVASSSFSESAIMSRETKSHDGRRRKEDEDEESEEGDDVPVVEGLSIQKSTKSELPLRFNAKKVRLIEKAKRKH